MDSSKKALSPWERKALQDKKLAELGINEEFINRLVDTFYAKVHEHTELGPIFVDVLAGDWELHLAKMKDFWTSLVLGSKRYSGNPLKMHKQIIAIEPQHFSHWLDLFAETLRGLSDKEEVIDYFLHRAQRIANNFQLNMYGGVEYQLDSRPSS